MPAPVRGPDQDRRGTRHPERRYTSASSSTRPVSGSAVPGDRDASGHRRRRCSIRSTNRLCGSSRYLSFVSVRMSAAGRRSPVRMVRCMWWWRRRRPRVFADAARSSRLFFTIVRSTRGRPQLLQRQGGHHTRGVGSGTRAPRVTDVQGGASQVFSANPAWASPRSVHPERRASNSLSGASGPAGQGEGVRMLSGNDEERTSGTRRPTTRQTMRPSFISTRTSRCGGVELLDVGGTRRCVVGRRQPPGAPRGEEPRQPASTSGSSLRSEVPSAR